MTDKRRRKEEGQTNKRRKSSCLILDMLTWQLFSLFFLSNVEINIAINEYHTFVPSKNNYPHYIRVRVKVKVKLRVQVKVTVNVKVKVKVQFSCMVQW